MLDNNWEELIDKYGKVIVTFLYFVSNYHFKCVAIHLKVLMLCWD